MQAYANPVLPSLRTGGNHSATPAQSIVSSEMRQHSCVTSNSTTQVDHPRSSCVFSCKTNFQNDDSSDCRPSFDAYRLSPARRHIGCCIGVSALTGSIPAVLHLCGNALRLLSYQERNIGRSMSCHRAATLVSHHYSRGTTETVAVAENGKRMHCASFLLAEIVYRY